MSRSVALSAAAAVALQVEQRLQVERESHLAAQKRVLDAEAAKRAAALEARLRAQLAQAEELAAARDETVALLRHKLGVSEDNVRQLRAELQQRSWQRAEEISAQTDAHAQVSAVAGVDETQLTVACACGGLERRLPLVVACHTGFERAPQIR
eukprot:6192444-Pleurochrysis_carterae.AAC.1